MENCLFCRIASGEIPSKKVYEDRSSFAFLDINPRNPGHTLVIPKNHAQDIFSIGERDAAELMKAIRKVAIGVKKATGAKGISITQNNGQTAGQVVPHIHFHVIPRTEAEKGLGLESVLPVKNQDEAGLDSMAKKISVSIPQDSPPEKKAEPVQEEASGKEEPKPSDEDKPSGEDKKAEPVSRKPQAADRQRIDFNF